MESSVTILFFGDLIGNPGCELMRTYVPQLREKYGADLVIVNGENSAFDGRGITPAAVSVLKESGVDIITTGNHVWAKKEGTQLFAGGMSATDPLILRPANFPTSCPGTGVALVTTGNGVNVGVINIQGRVFMRELLSCPFREADDALMSLLKRTSCVFADFHAEASSEKLGMGYYLDGRISAVVGTHTHIQTADERILPGGTAYITDVGMCGALNSMIGVKKEIVLQNMLTQMPVKFAVETEPPFVINGVVVKIDAQTGKARSIERVYLVQEGKVVYSESKIMSKA